MKKQKLLKNKKRKKIIAHRSKKNKKRQYKLRKSIKKTRIYKKRKKVISPVLIKKKKRHYRKRIKPNDNVDIIPINNIVSPSLDLPKKPRKKRSKKGGVIYFSKETEQKVIEYNNTTDDTIRNEIYNNHIKYPFEKLVENIFNTFKFTYFETSPLNIQKEALSHLVANMDKFVPEKGKAFSYFSIIVKRYLIALSNTNYKRFNTNVNINDENEDHSPKLQYSDKYHKNYELKEFIRLMVDFWDKNIGKIFTKQRDLDIANAVIELFRNSDRLECFSKKALYIFIREISNCKTTRVTKIINIMKEYQRNITKSYVNDGVVDMENI